MAFAVVLAITVEVARGTGWSLGDHSWGTWVAAGASGCLYYGLAFWFYLGALRHLDASVAGSFLPLIPVFGVASSFVVGERLDARQWLGALAVIAATGVVAMQQRRMSTTK